MQTVLEERKVELIYEQQEACEALSAELCNAHVDQTLVERLTQRIQLTSGRILELERLIRYTKRREVK